MAVYSPAPSYASIPALTHLDSPSYISPQSSSASSSPPAIPSPSPRHISRSERMLLATLRRAEEHTQKGDAGASDPDYFTRAMDTAWSKSQSVNASPSRTYKHLPAQSYLVAPQASESRSHSPITTRGVEREGSRHHRGRTPSPSPHPYHRSSSPAIPTLHRNQTTPARAQLTSRPSTPSQLPRTSSPVRRRQSCNGNGSASVSPSGYQKRTAHEDLLRTRLESVLAKQQQQEAALDGTASAGGRSRGPSFSRTAPPAGAAFVATASTTVTGDQWNWAPQNTSAPAVHLAAATPPSPKATRRSPSVSHPQRTASSSQLSGMGTVRTNAMITPPPSPPNQQQMLTETPSSGSSRAHSQSRQQLGIGRPSRDSSVGTRLTPPPTFDARSASLALKQQHGYVSFCEVEGLGEPEGMDGDDSEGEGEDGEGRGRGKWWEVWRK